jgi:hypothetical protein
LELKERIWGHTMEDGQVIKLNWNPVDGFKLRSLFPVAFRVNQVSKQHAQREYKDHFTLGPKKIGGENPHHTKVDPSTTRRIFSISAKTVGILMGKFSQSN